MTDTLIAQAEDKFCIFSLPFPTLNLVVFNKFANALHVAIHGVKIVKRGKGVAEQFALLK